MARVPIKRMQAVRDPLQTWQWEVRFPRVPGKSDTSSLTVKAISTTVPNHKVETAAWEGHGMKLNFSGRRTWDGTWDCTFIVDGASETRADIVNWIELQRSWKKNSGSYKAEYAVPVELVQFDAADNVSRTIKLNGAFPTDTGSMSLDNQTGILQMPVQFSFDYTEEE